MSKTNYFAQYMVNEQKFDREQEVQASKSHDWACPDDMRDGFVTSLLTGNRYTMKGGIGDFMKKDWRDELNNTYVSMHEYFQDENHQTRLPKDKAELARVARLFRETYIAYFLWCMLTDIRDGLSPSVFHYMADRIQDGYFMFDRWDFYDPKEVEDGSNKYVEQLWAVFWDRVYGRSEKFNFTDFVVANSVLAILYDIYWKREAQEERKKEDVEHDLELKLGIFREEENRKKVEAFLNGKDDN